MIASIRFFWISFFKLRRVKAAAAAAPTGPGP
jgi:hypothetical protein